MKKLLLLLLLSLPSINYSQSLVQLAERNDLNAIIKAVQNGMAVNQVDNNGFTALHIASWNGYVDIVQFLLDVGANPNIVSHAGSTPLRFATSATKEILLRYGAVNSPPAVKAPRSIYSPRIYVQSDNPTRLIVSNVVTNTETTLVTNIDNYTIMYDYPKLSYDILSNVSPEQSVALHSWDHDGNNSIHRAARIGDLREIQRLVSQGVNPKALNTTGDTALRFAAENSHFDVVQYLIENIGIDVNLANNYGTTPLIVATFANNPRVIQYLTKMGANVNQTASANVRRTVGGEEQEFEISGFTALMAASQLGYDDSVKTLLDNGANINAGDSDNWTALMFAVQNDHIDTADLLIDRGINFNKESSDNLTALSLAIQNGNADMINLLDSVNATEGSIPMVSYEESYTEGDYYYEDYGDDYYYE